MTVVAQVRNDNVVARLCMVGKIRRQVVKRYNVCDTFGRLRIQSIVHIIEIHLCEVLNVEKAEVEWTSIENRASEIRLPVDFP